MFKTEVVETGTPIDIKLGSDGNSTEVKIGNTPVDHLHSLRIETGVDTVSTISLKLTHPGDAAVYEVKGLFVTEEDAVLFKKWLAERIAFEAWQKSTQPAPVAVVDVATAQARQEAAQREQLATAAEQSRLATEAEKQAAANRVAEAQRQADIKARGRQG